MIVKFKRARHNAWSNLKTYSGSKTRIGAPLDRNGYVVTGLTKDDETRLEEALGLPKGGLAKGSVANPNPFWIEYSVDLEEDKVMVLDTELPDDELKYLFLKAQNKVANGVSELENNAKAIFVLFNDEEEAVKENKRGKNKLLAYTEFSNMSTDTMKHVLMLYGKQPTSTSSAVIENTLQKLIDDDPIQFLAHAKDPKMKDKVFIFDLLRAGILMRKSQAFVEYGSEDILAYDMDGMVEFLQAKVNNAKVLQFKQALKNRG